MINNYTEEEMGTIIGCWVEAMHIDDVLSTLVENTDEVGELYETDQWLKLEVPEREDSFLGLLKDLEDVEDRASAIVNVAGTRLMEMMKWAITKKVGVWGKYPIAMSDSFMSDLMGALIEDFDEIYNYNLETQLENFYKVLDKRLHELYG